MAEEIPDTSLRAQVALVRAAKTAIRDTNPTAIGELRVASDALAGASGQPDSSSHATAQDLPPPEVVPAGLGALTEVEGEGQKTKILA